jgi:hypothetical protein
MLSATKGYSYREKKKRRLGIPFSSSNCKTRKITRANSHVWRYIGKLREK